MARILVIEDDPASMKLTTKLLENAGHTVLCAVDAETGLTLALSGHPDLIVMDFLLPGMDGLEATTLLKTDPTTAAIPIIVLSAVLKQDDEKRVRAAGCDAFIAKPFRQQELQEAIADLLHEAIDALLLKSGPHMATPKA